MCSPILDILQTDCFSTGYHLFRTCKYSSVLQPEVKQIRETAISLQGVPNNLRSFRWWLFKQIWLNFQVFLLFSCKTLNGKFIELFINQEFSQIFNSTDYLVWTKRVTVHSHSSYFGLPGGVHPENIKVN